MTNRFTELRTRMKPDSKVRAEAKANQLFDEMPLNKLSQARDLSHKLLAELLNVQQPAIAKLEEQADMYLSTLRSYIEAMEGELDITARFPSGAVKISNFSGLENLRPNFKS